MPSPSVGRSLQFLRWPVNCSQIQAVISKTLRFRPSENLARACGSRRERHWLNQSNGAQRLPARDRQRSAAFNAPRR